MNTLRKYCWTVALMVACLMVGPIQRSDAQIAIVEVIKAGVKKVIKAVDLKIQRLQNKTIWLQNAQKTLENTMAKLKLDDIAGWVNKQKELYEKYYQELWKVKMVITYYSEIKDISEKQVKLIQEYQSAWKLFKKDKHFTTGELHYMAEVYSGILKETEKNVDMLLLVAHFFTTRMSDADRLKLIHETDQKVDQNYNDLLLFNQQNSIISLQRKKAENSLDAMRKLFSK